MTKSDVDATLSETTGSTVLTVDIRALIEFFDVDTEAQQDASSIKAIIGEEFAIACMKHYFENHGTTGCTNAYLLKQHGSDHRLACTTGGRAGYQLDGWFIVKRNGVTTCYQTEIKSWSFHGIGSSDRRLLIEAKDPTKVIGKMREIFAHYYDATKQTLEQSGTQKVLLKMKQPYNSRNKFLYPTQNPKPLLCLWEALCRHDATSSEVFFSVPVAPITPLTKQNGAVCEGGGFNEVHIFSVSNYLRQVLANAPDSEARLTIRLPLPRIAKRMRLLSAMFSQPKMSDVAP